MTRTDTNDTFVPDQQEMTVSASTDKSPLAYDLSAIPLSILTEEVARRLLVRVGNLEVKECDFCGQFYSNEAMPEHHRVCVKNPRLDKKLRIRDCEYCGAPFPAREMRIHIPRCKKNPMSIRRKEIRKQKAAKRAAEKRAAKQP